MLTALNVASNTRGGCDLSKGRRGGSRGGEERLPSIAPSFSLRRAVGVPKPPSAGMSSVLAVAPCDGSGPASACQIMTTHSRRNRPKTLVDLESDDCRWPLGDPRQPNFHFCGSLQDRKSTRLNSSHLGISYAVF